MSNPSNNELAASGIVLDVSGTPSRRRYLLTLNANTEYPYRREFTRKRDRDEAAQLEMQRQERRRLDASGPADMSQVFAQETAKRALEIAAAGGHVILLFGPDGCAKSMLKERIPTLGGKLKQVLTGPRANRPADMYVQMSPTSGVDMALPPPAERSADIATRVATARALLASTEPCDLDFNAHALLTEAAERMALTGAAVITVRRVARTIAALDGQTNLVRRIHIAEALSYHRPQKA